MIRNENLTGETTLIELSRSNKSDIEAAPEYRDRMSPGRVV